MPEVIDSVTFGKGLNLRKNTAALSDGELLECSGFTLDNDGYIKATKPRSQVHHSPYGEIKNIHRYVNTALLCEGKNIRYRWDLRGYCDLYNRPDEEFTTIGTGDAERYRIIDYRNWIFMANGHANKLFSKDTLFPWGVENPTVAPGGTAGAAGNPNGTYTLYYTYYVKFPNGEIVETGPSPSGSVSVTNQKIEWSGIGICPYSGSGVQITRRLYRYSAVLAATYYVTEIGDNTTQTYSDNSSDGTLQVNEELSTESYSVPPDGFVDIELYLQRIFGIKETYLYWSEAYRPINFMTSSSINVTSEGNELMSVMYWGDQLYLASKSKWYRLYGSDPDTWGIKNTYAENGVINTHTVQATKYGIVGLWHDGIYLFDGATAKNITEKRLGRSLFTGISDKSVCHASYDGLKYYFYYPSSGTALSDCIVADFTFYPEIRFYNDPFIATAHEYHVPTGRRYLARLD